MIALYCLLGIAAFLCLLLFLPVHLMVSFDKELKIRARYAFVSLKLYPRPEKPEKEKPKKEKKAKQKKGKPAQEEISVFEQLLREDGITGVVQYFTEMARLVGAASRRSLAAITVDRIRLRVVVATGDAAQTAVDYGRVCAAVYPAEGLIESVVRVKRRSIEITTDFLREKSEISGMLRLHVRLFRILWIALLFFIGYIGNTIRKEPA